MMKIGEFDIMITDSVDRDGLSAEIQKDGLGLAEVYLDHGRPVIEIGPNRRNEFGVWTIDYGVLKQTMQAVDDFLASIGYPSETERSSGA